MIPCVMPFLAAKLGQAETDTQADRQTDIVWKGYRVMIPCVMPFLAAEMRKKRQL